jgi:hypothetical protein
MIGQESVSFVSGGVRCAGRVYRPVGATGTLPSVAMGHGFSGTMDMLTPYAERFAEAGLAVLTFDYPYFGESGASRASSRASGGSAQTGAPRSAWLGGTRASIRHASPCGTRRSAVAMRSPSPQTTRASRPWWRRCRSSIPGAEDQACATSRPWWSSSSSQQRRETPSTRRSGASGRSSGGSGWLV